MMDHNETLKLIEKAQNGDEDAMQTLIVQNSPLIKCIVKRFLGRSTEFDDLFQLGSIGLLKAVRNFQTKYNVKFSTYAVPMIIGEIKRFLRDDGSIKVSRAVKALCGQINEFVAGYEEKNQTKPSIEEISQKFNIEPHEVVFVMDSAKNSISLFATSEEDSSGLSVIDRLTVKNDGDDIFNKFVLSEALETLSEREKIIIFSRFFNDKTQNEIAKILGISQVQVSRLEFKIIEDLKSKLN
ncbi:MAG: sigma-70 family RNA polymerase sigma factor [Clostridia bacterium]